MLKEEGEKIVLRSSDGEEFVVEKRAAIMSETLKSMDEEGCVEGLIPLHTVTSKTLAKLIEYCNKHTANSGESLHAWDADFVESADLGELFDLIMAANFLNIKALIDLTTQAVADHIKDMSAEKVRALFNITNDFTPEEEQAIRDQNPWVFDV